MRHVERGSVSVLPTCCTRYHKIPTPCLQWFQLGQGLPPLGIISSERLSHGSHCAQRAALRKCVWVCMTGVDRRCSSGVGHTITAGSSLSESLFRLVCSIGFRVHHPTIHPGDFSLKEYLVRGGVLTVACPAVPPLTWVTSLCCWLADQVTRFFCRPSRHSSDPLSIAPSHTHSAQPCNRGFILLSTTPFPDSPPLSLSLLSGPV